MRNKIVAACLALAAMPAGASQTRHFVLDTPHALAGALSNGVAVFPDGTMRPIPPLGLVAQFEEPLGLALAVADDGTAFVGTGHPARLYRVKDGKKELIGKTDADQVTALLLDPAGNLYAATVAPALLLRVAHGASAIETVTKLPEGNLWDLAWYRGALVAAAGNPGRLLRLGAKGFELAAEVQDKHARCLAVSGDELIVGTSGKGLILRWNGAGLPAVLYDSSFTEIAALAAAPDGAVYAAGLTGDPTLGKAPAKGDGEATVTVSTSATPPPQAADRSTATSEIVRVLPNGAATVVHRFTKQLAGTLAWSANGLVIGTGLEGEVWQIIEGSAARLDSVDCAQVVKLGRGGDWVLSQGPVKLLRRSGDPRGSFTSPVLDAQQPAVFGEYQVRGEIAAFSSCSIKFRTGASALADESWNAWTQPAPCTSGRAAALPARYLQWKLDFAAKTGARAEVEQVKVAYRQRNLPPEVKEFGVFEPGEVFLKSPPPSERIVEVQHPDLSGIFTTLDEDGQERQDRLGKRYYRVGYQSLSWKVEDPNGDPLRFSIQVQRAGGDAWWPVRENLEATSIAIDTQALPDGVYRFRLLASDVAANPDAPATAEALSSWVTVDNTPPRLAITREGSVWVVKVEDDASPITRIEWNRDADVWHPVPPEDGTLDSRRQTVRIPAQGGRHVLAVRAVDDHHNRANVAVEERP